MNRRVALNPPMAGRVRDFRWWCLAPTALATFLLMMWPLWILTPRASDLSVSIALLQAVIGEGGYVVDGDVSECEGRGTGHRAGHIRHAVVEYGVHLVGGLRVCGRPYRLDAAALVDRDVYYLPSPCSCGRASRVLRGSGSSLPAACAAPMRRSQPFKAFSIL